MHEIINSSLFSLRLALFSMGRKGRTSLVLILIADPWVSQSAYGANKWSERTCGPLSLGGK